MIPNAFRVDVYIHNDRDTTDAKLDRILAAVAKLQKQEERMAASLDALTAQVQSSTDVEQSALVLIQGIAAALAAAQNDPVAIAALADRLKSSADALAAAVVANTPPA